MTIPHWNDFRGGYEYLDNPLEDCGCDGCTNGRAELWGEEPGHSSRGNVGRVVGGIVTGFGVASTIGGGVANPQQLSDTTKQHYGQSSLQSKRERRIEEANDATRDKGRRGGWSGQQ